MAGPSADAVALVIIVGSALTGLQLGGMARDLQALAPSRRSGQRLLFAGGLLLFGAMIAFFALGLHESP
jgi:hypothetical protein